MTPDLVNRLTQQMQYEFDRTAPPEGFPKFHDIPVERFTSDEFWELEQKYLWPRSWVIAGRSEDIPNVGDFFTFDDLGVPILLIRGKDSQVRAFYNTCQHRGAPVVRESSGTSKLLRCQYHSWSYDIDSGQLVSVPDERDFVDLDKTERCLPSISCAVWDNWIFVNQDANAISLAEHIGSIADEMSEFQGQSLRTVAKQSEIVPCNWKVTAEAFLEVYHFRHIHSRNGESLLDNRGATMGLLPNGCSRMVTPFSKTSYTALGMKNWDDYKHVVLPGFTDIETVNDMVRCTSTAFGIFPNLITPVAAYGFPFITFWPIDKQTTRIDWTHYAPIDFEPREGLPANWQARLDNFALIMQEDFWNMAPMQKSLESPAMRGMPINYQERRIWNFHEEVDRLIGIERIPEELRVEQLLAPYIEP
jgi:phenylpropionate dioxygenase-like ring-hydroxylating dioxygenase large terminal subunit